LNETSAEVRKRRGHIFFEWNKCLWSYYYCFVTRNRKTSTLDIVARHPKTDVALLCVISKLWKLGILYTIRSTFMW
jgi:hypothetical protein